MAEFRGRSIRFRLTAWYAGILAVTFAVGGTLVLFAVEDAAEDTVDRDLRARFAAVRDELAREFDDKQAEHAAEELEEQASGPGGVWLQVADQKGHWLYRSDAIKDQNAAPPSTDGLPAGGRTRTLVIQGRPLRVLTAPFAGGVVQMGTPMSEFIAMLRQLECAMGLSSPLLLAVACAGGYWMSGRALQPVDEIARTVERIGSRNLAERLSLRGTGDELDRLSCTLNQMLARLESAFQMVTQFTADASHELRTPVAIIRTTGEVIRSARRAPEEHEEAWDQVVAQTERMSSLVEDLLFLARADAGRFEASFEPMDLAQTVRAVSGEIRILAEASGLRLTISAPAECPMTGDRDAIRRVLLVLLDNAIKYTGAGGEVTVCMRIDEGAERRRAVIEVRDTGIGIAPADLARVFDRFYRVASDRSRQSGGAGLGLSIARWLASLHGGEIVAESEPGKGSSFRVLLPI